MWFELLIHRFEWFFLPFVLPFSQHIFMEHVQCPQYSSNSGYILVNKTDLIPICKEHSLVENRNPINKLTYNLWLDYH